MSDEELSPVGRRCLECGAATAGRHCAECGQAADTGRLTLRYVLRHDIAKTFFYLDGGLARTTRDLLVRPGHAAREYVEGRRTRHFNPFRMLAVLALLDGLLRFYWGFSLADPESQERGQRMLAWVQTARAHDGKWLVLAIIPVRAALSLLIFRSARQNYTEHLVLEAYASVGALILSVLASIVLDVSRASASTGQWVVNVCGLLTLVYQTVFYAQYFSRSGYGAPALYGRSVLTTSAYVATVAALIMSYELLAF